jgi:CRP-like cAMP-binding protein
VAEADAWLRRDWIAPGMELIAQGGQTGQLYVLKEGELEVLRDGTHITTIKTPGSVIGEMSVLLGAPQTATVRAITAVDFFVIDNAIEVLRSHPDWLLQIARLLAQRVRTRRRSWRAGAARTRRWCCRRTSSPAGAIRRYERQATAQDHLLHAVQLAAACRLDGAGGALDLLARDGRGGAQARHRWHLRDPSRW